MSTIMLLSLFLCSFCYIFPQAILATATPTRGIRLPLRRTRWIPKASAHRSRSAVDVDVLVDDASNSYPLHGGVDNSALYTIDLGIGTPPQSVRVQVDSGSSDLAIFSTLCANCSRHFDAKFNPGASTSWAPVGCPSTTTITCQSCSADQQCAYKNVYGDGSGYHALVGRDVLGLGPLQVTGTVGAISVVTGKHSFEPSTCDGILGVAFQSLSTTNSSTLLDQFAAKGLVPNLFSMCLNATGGQFGLGNILPYYAGDLTYVPLLKPEYWSVYMADLQIFGKSLGLPPATYNDGNAIVDTGSTALVLPSKAFDVLRGMFTGHCSTQHLPGICDTPSGSTLFDGKCAAMSPSDVLLFPTLQIMLNGVQLQVPPTAYLQPGFCTEEGKFYMLIQSNPGGTILGDAVLVNYMTVFDKDNSRVGFAAVQDCPSY